MLNCKFFNSGCVWAPLKAFNTEVCCGSKYRSSLPVWLEDGPGYRYISGKPGTRSMTSWLVGKPISFLGITHFRVHPQKNMTLSPKVPGSTAWSTGHCSTWGTPNSARRPRQVIGRDVFPIPNGKPPIENPLYKPYISHYGSRYGIFSYIWLIFYGKCRYVNIPCMDPMGIVGIYVLQLL